MPYVERRDLRVVGRYARPQPGYAEEWLDDGHPDLLPTPAELAAEAAKQAERDSVKQLQTEAKADAMFKALEKANAKQIADWIDAQFSGMTAQQRALLKMLTQVAAMALRERN